MALARNRVVRRRLRFTLVALAAIAAVHYGRIYAFPQFTSAPTIEQLLLALALINAAVTLLFNPWFDDRVLDRSPAIVQDTLVVAVFGGAAVVLLDNATFLTASAIAAAAVGFALQDTLGNAFAGLAIQIEKPFRVGQWIAVANYEGTVAEVTWRATKIRTKAGNLVVIPNNVIAKEVINNYSEPAAPTRSVVEVGAAYEAAPNDVRAAIMTALRQVPEVLWSPAPDALVADFGASAIVYRARYWIRDFSREEETKDAVRRAIYYEFRRRNIEIPWPIQIQYSREQAPADAGARRPEFARTIAAVPVFTGLPEDANQALAASADERLYGDGEVIVHEADAGASMFVVQRGAVAVTVGPERREVAVTHAGGYFGEMSLLTGEPRTATVVARGDCTVLEINSAAFGAYVRNRPEVLESLAAAAIARRRELEATRAAGASVPAIEPVTLVQRMRRFFGIRNGNYDDDKPTRIVIE